MDSRVAWATPPRAPEGGEGRMKGGGWTASRAMRVLSPRIDPPERADDGSTASTATFEPALVRSTPSWSMKVDLPTPGTPLMPIRRAPPACGSSSTSSSCARSRWSPRRDSTSVIARATTRRSPASTPSTSAGTSIGRLTPRPGRPKWPLWPLSSVTQARGERPQQVLGGLGDDRARQEHRRGTHLLERGHVVGWDDPADDDHHVVGTE